MTTIRTRENPAIAQLKGMWARFKPAKPQAGHRTDGDRNSARGLDRLHKAARTGPLMAMPWENRGPSLESLKSEYGDKLNPRTLRRLDKLEREGKLTADEGGRSIATVVDKLMKNGAEPRMVDALIRQIANPLKHIKQADPMSCIATDGQIQMAMFTPARYLDFMGDLMANGKAELKGFGDFSIGKEAHEHNMDAPGWNARLNEMAQRAFMQLAEGNGVRGTNFADGMRFLQKLTGLPVMNPDLLRKAIEEGGEQGVSRNQVTQDLLRQQMAAAYTAGQPGLFVALSHKDTDEAHMVMITGMDGEGNISFCDGIHEARQMHISEFSRYVTMFSDKDVGAGRVMRVVPPPTDL